jgi:putative sterol carrier protein
MADAIAEFFDRLARREHEVRLEDINGTVQIQIDRDGGTDQWLLSIRRGDISVAREERPADCVARVDRKLFEGLARGEENAIAAMLRGAMTVVGDLYLLLTFERLLPTPPGTRDPRAAYQEAFR